MESLGDEILDGLMRFRKAITIEANAGESILHFGGRAADKAREVGHVVIFNFNDTWSAAYPDDSEMDVADRWWAKRNRESK